ncbi:MAG TPA: glycosyltransferase family 39 protein [Vicinamibacterales bacterium]|nr:glycosyltransferase family 39 protein [Vicinamibacterales bacterium]
MAWRRLLTRWSSLFAWVAIGWIVVFWRLGYASLLDPDEAHYAELTREMLHSGSWLVPLLDGKPFIDKPVLFHWLQGASVLFLGETEFAARLPTALSAVGLFAITRWVGVALFDAEVGTLGAIMFATIPATFALASIAIFDMVFALFLFGAVGCLLVAAKQANVRTECWGYVLLTLAVMTKGPVALVLVVLFLATGYLMSADTRALWGGLHWRIGLPAVAIAASPWFVWMQWRFGDEFVKGYLLAGNLWYVTQPIEFSARAVNHTFYIRAFAGAFFPWSTVVAGRGLDAFQRLRRNQPLEIGERLLWLWTIVVFAFFSVARFKLDHYIFPAAPACCLLAAYGWREAARDLDGRLWGTRYSVLLVAGMLIVGGSFGGVALAHVNLALSPWALVLPLAIFGGGVGLLFQSERLGWRVPAGIGVLVVALLVSYATVVAVGFPALEQVRPTARVARQLARVASPTAPVGLYQLERWRGSLRYYLNRPIDRLETVGDVSTFLSRQQPVYVVMLRRDYLALREQGAPVHLLTAHRAVVGTSGRGLRRQRWGFLVVVTNVQRKPRTERHQLYPPVRRMTD